MPSGLNSSASPISEGLARALCPRREGEDDDDERFLSETPLVNGDSSSIDKDTGSGVAAFRRFEFGADVSKRGDRDDRNGDDPTSTKPPLSDSLKLVRHDGDTVAFGCGNALGDVISPMASIVLVNFCNAAKSRPMSTIISGDAIGRRSVGGCEVDIIGADCVANPRTLGDRDRSLRSALSLITVLSRS